MSSSRPPTSWLRDSPGAILGIFRSEQHPLTKSELVDLSRLSRSAINARVAPLIEVGILRLTSAQGTTGGRPAERYELNPDRGVVLVVDTGATGLRAAVCDLSATILHELTLPIDIADGPQAILGRIGDLFSELLQRAHRTPAQVLGIGIAAPGPVDHRSGRAICPPIMTGWHDFDIPAYFRPRFDCPVLVEKDTNAMAFGEQRIKHRETENLVFLKLGTGIGTGLVIQDEIYRGADGAAGDIGHIPLTDSEATSPAPLCRCGNRGCIEAYAAGWAMVRELDQPGRRVRSVEVLIALAEARDPEVLQAVRRSAGIIGTAVSDLVNIVNPRTIVIGGQLAAIEGGLISGIRETVYRRALPLATRDLEIIPSALGSHAGVHGLALLVTDEVFSAERIDRLLASR